MRVRNPNGKVTDDVGRPHSRVLPRVLDSAPPSSFRGDVANVCLSVCPGCFPFWELSLLHVASIERPRRTRLRPAKFESFGLTRPHLTHSHRPQASGVRGTETARSPKARTRERARTHAHSGDESRRARGSLLRVVIQDSPRPRPGEQSPLLSEFERPTLLGALGDHWRTPIAHSICVSSS